MELENNAYFWQKIDMLLLSSDTVIDRKKNTTHPTYNSLVYPVDYGYLRDTMADSQEHISVYVGSKSNNMVEAIIVCADILKKDIEVKLVVGCTDEEENAILEFLNQTDFQKSIIIRRGHDIPKWANTI